MPPTSGLIVGTGLVNHLKKLQQTKGENNQTGHCSAEGFSQMLARPVSVPTDHWESLIFQ